MRPDGRENEQIRDLKITRNVNIYAEGSCLIEFGNTKVLCTATVEDKVPPFLRGTNKGWVTAEYRMLPRATQNRVYRDKVSGRVMEIQRLIGRSLRSVVNMEKLGERTIWIDCDVLQADGGTRVTSVTGGFVALADAVYKIFKEGKVGDGVITNIVAAVSVGMIKGHYILDLNYDEDSKADVDINVVMKDSGEFIELQGTAENGSFSKDDLLRFLELGEKGVKEIMDKQREMFRDFTMEIN
ncbi:MAG: ribonuclease PH [Candidatus Omnitrophica bacterium]|nr:ribonuclease PH [Candidatus Omnitrophota bacterium]